MTATMMTWPSMRSALTTSAVDEHPHFITSPVEEQYLLESLSTLHACSEHGLCTYQAPKGRYDVWVPLFCLDRRWRMKTQC